MKRTPKVLRAHNFIPGELYSFLFKETLTNPQGETFILKEETPLLFLSINQLTLEFLYEDKVITKKVEAYMPFCVYTYE